MAKRKKLTPETAEQHNAALNIALLNHCAALNRVARHLLFNDTKGAVKEISSAVKVLERACFKNAKELGYEPKVRK